MCLEILKEVCSSDSRYVAWGKQGRQLDGAPSCCGLESAMKLVVKVKPWKDIGCLETQGKGLWQAAGLPEEPLGLLLQSQRLFTPTGSHPS